MRRKLSSILIILMILAGLSLLLYPTVSNYILSLSFRQTITDYREGITKLDDSSYDTLLTEARAYNERLAAKGSNMRDPTEEELPEYYSLLDPTGTGVMGYVVIPKINVSLPIYHGTDDTALQGGIGHLPGTSLPVGGEGTHAIISGHRGLPSSRLFTDIDQLVVGDTFSLRVLNETLFYEVDQIITILPSELGKQRIEAGEDYCTLLTCTPYGINTHRLLVRGRRIEAPVASATDDPSSVQQPDAVLAPDLEAEAGFAAVERTFWLLIGAGGLMAVLLVLLVFLLFWTRERYEPKRLKDQ